PAGRPAAAPQTRTAPQGTSPVRPAVPSEAVRPVSEGESPSPSAVAPEPASVRAPSSVRERAMAPEHAPESPTASQPVMQAQPAAHNSSQSAAMTPAASPASGLLAARNRLRSQSRRGQEAAEPKKTEPASVKKPASSVLERISNQHAGRRSQ